MAGNCQISTASVAINASSGTTTSITAYAYPCLSHTILEIVWSKCLHTTHFRRKKKDVYWRRTIPSFRLHLCMDWKAEWYKCDGRNMDRGHVDKESFSCCKEYLKVDRRGFWESETLDFCFSPEPRKTYKKQHGHLQKFWSQLGCFV